MSDGGNEYGTIPSLVAKHEVTRAIFERSRFFEDYRRQIEIRYSGIFLRIDNLYNLNFCSFRKKCKFFYFRRKKKYICIYKIYKKHGIANLKFAPCGYKGRI